MMRHQSRRHGGYTLTEVLTTCGLMMFLILGVMELLSFGARTYQRTTTDADLTNTNVNGTRRVVDALRQAMSISISTDGKRVEYFLPLRSDSNDPTTGERELLDPLTPEITARAFEITNGELKDTATGRILVKNILPTDPDPNSSQYGQSYAPFQVTTIGSRRALTVNLITDRKTSSGERYVRMKTTVLVRNSQ